MKFDLRSDRNENSKDESRSNATEMSSTEFAEEDQFRCHRRYYMVAEEFFGADDVHLKCDEDEYGVTAADAGGGAALLFAAAVVLMANRVLSWEVWAADKGAFGSNDVPKPYWKTDWLPLHCY
jgi:hypothetical protein